MSQQRGVLSRWQQLTRLHVSDLSILNLRTPFSEGCGREPTGSELVRTRALRRASDNALAPPGATCVLCAGETHGLGRARGVVQGARMVVWQGRSEPLPALDDSSC
jgi:hypothetical protein